MAALIQRIAVQALKTFAKGNSFAVKQQNLTNLKALMKQVVPADLVIDESLFADRSEYVPNDETAPVTYISVWSDPTYSMGVFILRNRARLPLHDHPGMDGLIKVIHGSVDVRSFSRVDLDPVDGPVRDQLVRVREEQGDEDDVFVARELTRGLTVDTSSDVVALSANEGNFHEIRATNGPAAFLDILAPPYDDPPGPRGCSYYRSEALRRVDDQAGPTPETDLVFLVKIPLPDDYWSDSQAYEGPDVDPYSPLSTEAD